MSLNLLLKIDMFVRPLGVDKEDVDDGVDFLNLKEDVDDDAGDNVDFLNRKGVILPDLLALKKLCD